MKKSSMLSGDDVCGETVFQLEVMLMDEAMPLILPPYFWLRSSNKVHFGFYS